LFPGEFLDIIQADPPHKKMVPANSGSGGNDED